MNLGSDGWVPINESPKIDSGTQFLNVVHANSVCAKKISIYGKDLIHILSKLTQRIVALEDTNKKLNKRILELEI
jgi:hypothetical protein